MLRKIFIPLFVLFLTAGPVIAQNANVSFSLPSAGRAANGNYSGPYVEPPKSILRGRIIYEDNGKPLRRGDVSLVNAETMSKVYDSKTFTDDSGEFEIGAVRAGSYYVAVDVPGILNPMNYQGFYSATDEDRKVSFAKLDRFFQRIVTDGLNESHVVVLVKRSGAIAGRVTYADGDPAPGIRVEALRKGPNGFEGASIELYGVTGNAGVTETDDRGYYRFPGLPPGQYIVFIREKANHSTALDFRPYSDRSSELKTYYPNGYLAKDAKVLDIALGQQEDTIDITIPDRKLYKLSGVVLSKADKKPVKAAVRIERMEDEGILDFRMTPFDRTFSADEQGKWAVKDLPVGSYRITIQLSDNYEAQADQKEPGAKKPPKLGVVIKEIKIIDEAPENMITELPLESVISGVVVVEGGAPVPKSLFIYALLKDAIYTFSVGSEYNADETKRASFKIGNVPAGENNVYAYINGDSGVFVKSIKWGGKDITTSTLRVGEGEEIKDVEIVLSDKTGTLKVSLKAPPEIIDFPSVVLLPVGKSQTEVQRQVRSITPTAGGTFEMKAAPGEYFVCLLDDARNGEAWEEWYKKVSHGAPKIDLREGETVTITLELPKK